MSLIPPLANNIAIPAGARVRVHRMGDSPTGAEKGRSPTSKTTVVEPPRAGKPAATHPWRTPTAAKRAPKSAEPKAVTGGRRKPEIEPAIVELLSDGKARTQPEIQAAIRFSRCSIIHTLRVASEAGRLIRDGQRRHYTYRLPGLFPPASVHTPAPSQKARASNTKAPPRSGNPVKPIVIEDDIPIQTKRNPGALFPTLDALKVGQSFSYHRHINLAHMRDRLGRKQFYQTTDPKDATRIRIWRTA